MEVRLRGITREWQPEPLHHRLQRRSLEADPGRSFPGASDHPARFFENPRDVCPLDAVVNSAVDASGRAFCPELSCPSTHAARADGLRSGSAASSSRRMIEDIVALNRNARCPPRATSTFLTDIIRNRPKSTDVARSGGAREASSGGGLARIACIGPLASCPTWWSGISAPARYVGLVTSGPSRTEAAGARHRGPWPFRRVRRREDPQTGYAPRSRSYQPAGLP
jgi:hypothetical protein